MRINKIHIKNYRSIKDSTEISVTKLFALIGKNNTGKSAIVEAIQVFWGKKPLMESDFHKGTKDPIEVIITIRDYSDSSSFQKYQDVNGDIMVSFKATAEDIKGEYFIKGTKAKVADIKALLPNLLVIPAIRNPQNETTAGTKSYLKELTASFIDLSSSHRQKIEEIEKISAKDLTVDQINILLEDKIKNRTNQVSDKVSLYFQDALLDSTISLEINPEGDLSKAISFNTNLIDPHLGKNMIKVNILTCGTGLQSMAILSLLQAYADIEKHTESIMLIEEPEVYLHPELQRKMFSVLRKIAKNTQVIYTTHSPIMISELWADDSVRLIKRNNGETVISNIEIEQVISELGIRYEDVLNPKVIIFVEGTMDVEFFEMICKNINPTKMLGSDIKFIPTEGFKNIHVFALMQILYSHNVNPDFYIIADNDGKESRAEDLYKQITNKVPVAKSDGKIKLKDRIKILNVHELEEYFLDHDFINNIEKSVNKQDFDKFVAFYKNKYKEALNSYTKSKKENDRHILQQYYRPSKLFELLDNENKRQAISKAYDDNQDFMVIRDKIALAWHRIIRGSNSPISVLLQGLDVNSKEILSYPINLMKDVLKQIP